VLNGPQDVRLQKGEEIGPFILSSNVVMLFPENSIQLPADWASTRPLKIGEAMSRN
jgi:phosphatidylserine decarboxylase